MRARRESLRAAGAQYQRSENGRLRHAQRQRSYRARLREAAAVTHRGYSGAEPASAIVDPGLVGLGEPGKVHDATAVDGGHTGTAAHASGGDERGGQERARGALAPWSAASAGPATTERSAGVVVWGAGARCMSRDSKPPKLVHNIIFSMPPGTSPKKVLAAVRNLALNEWALQHRYAMALHTDEPHPHVHVVVKAMSEQGVRLNIKKANLRAWRAQFAANLREFGVAANATERAVRGETRIQKRTAIYRAEQRKDSSHMRQRRAETLKEASVRTLSADPGYAVMNRTRQYVMAGWHALAAQLSIGGEHQLAADIRSFVGRMPSVRTENEILREHLTGLKGAR